MKPFVETLNKLRQGAAAEELTEALHKVVQAVQNTGKAGSVTLKIKVSPTKGLALDLEDDITANAPTLAKPSTLLFPTTEGNLQEQNPLQRPLDLQVVAQPQAAAPVVLGTVNQQPVSLDGAPAPLASIG